VTRRRSFLLGSGHRGGLALAVLVSFSSFSVAQTPPKKPPQKPVLLPQPFQPNISNTENTTSSGDNPNVFSPWYNVIDDLSLPDDFDPLQAAAAAAVGQAEAAADAMSEPTEFAPAVPLSDLPIDDSGGAFLAYPSGVAFNSDSLLLSPGGTGFAILSKEAALPYGESSYPVAYSPRAIPIFKRVRELTRVGPFRVGVDVTAGVAHNNNVFGDTTNPQSDEIYSFLPAVFLEAGTRGKLYLLYAPTYLSFAKYKELSTTNQALFFQLRYPFTKLKIGIDLSYLSQSGLFLNSDEGFVKQTTLLGRIFGEYRLSGKSILAFSAESIKQESSPGGTQNENSASLRLIYQLTHESQVGVTVKAGQVFAPAENQNYQAAQLFVSYRPTVALQFAAEAGLELRRLSLTSSGQSELPITIFNFQVNYNPTSTTLFNLSFYRNALNTTFNNVSLNITTGVTSSVLLQLFGKLNVRLEMGVGYTEQYADEQGNDGSFSFLQGGITVSYPLVKNLEIQAFDSLQQRFGNTIGNDYVSNTIGVALTLKF